jgi:hypothetical protein
MLCAVGVQRPASRIRCNSMSVTGRVRSNGALVDLRERIN